MKSKDLEYWVSLSKQIEKGDFVKFSGCTREQINWGSNSDPEGLLVYGGIYYVNEVIVKSSHTKLVLRGIEGKFNSVCFEKM